jgi:hypothetical protein
MKTLELKHGNTELSISDLDQLLNTYKELQNLQHTLDELSDNVHFKYGIKNRTNMLQTEIDKTLKPLYVSMSDNEKESFNNIILKNENLKTV